MWSTPRQCRKENIRARKVHYLYFYICLKEKAKEEVHWIKIWIDILNYASLQEGHLGVEKENLHDLGLVSGVMWGITVQAGAATSANFQTKTQRLYEERTYALSKIEHKWLSHHLIPLFQILTAFLKLISLGMDSHWQGLIKALCTLAKSSQRTELLLFDCFCSVFP